MNLREFTTEGNYYTSYPPLNQWTEDFGKDEYEIRLSAFTESQTPCHLYIHIPFCAKLCYYCICNIVISNDREKIQNFLNHLLEEINFLKPYHPKIREIQLGGGTPSHLDRKQFFELCEKLNELVDLSSLDEFAMEIDPRTVRDGDLQFYSSLGVTRISFGVQDFDSEVQKAINRIQPYEMVSELMQERHFFKGVNFDLLYGLPLQTQKTIQETLAKVRRLSPDRVTLLKYCHAPELRQHMKLIKNSDLPPKDDLQEMFVEIVDSLKKDYEWIGLDHFAKPHDALSQAARMGTVGRTFNGFTPGRVRDLIGIGPTSTGAFGETYCQNIYTLPEYYASIEDGEFPILRGYRMTPDDLKRREIIFNLMCNQNSVIEGFEKELAQIPEDLGIYKDGRLTLTTQGRVLLRNICALFDNRKKKTYKIAQKSMTRRAA